MLIEYESIDYNTLEFSINSTFVKINFTTKIVHSPSKDSLIANWIEYINYYLRNHKKFITQADFYEFLVDILKEYPENLDILLNKPKTEEQKITDLSFFNNHL